MSDDLHPDSAPMVDTSTIGMLLVCFAERTGAARARRSIENRLQGQTDDVLDTVVCEVDANHRPRVYDPRRVLAGTVTAAVTWGIFGLLTGGSLSGFISSAILGAVLGGLGGYLIEHALSKSELTRIGTKLPASSSALLTFARTSDAHRLLDVGANCHHSVASAVSISNDVTASNVYARPEPERQPSRQAAILCMILVRYPDTETAEQVASRIGAIPDGANESFQIELYSHTDSDGRIHAIDPVHGVTAQARDNVLSWGVLGLVIGAIAGATGGGGVLGFVSGALQTGVFYGVFGAAAGALYGLWTGTAVSGHRLKGLAPLSPPGTSMLLAWAEGQVSEGVSSILGAPAAMKVMIGFEPDEHGAIISVAEEEHSILPEDMTPRASSQPYPERF